MRFYSSVGATTSSKHPFLWTHLPLPAATTHQPGKFPSAGSLPAHLPFKKRASQTRPPTSGFPGHPGNGARKGRGSSASVPPACRVPAGAWRGRTGCALQLSVGTGPGAGSGSRTDGHVNLSHAAARVARPGPAAFPPAAASLRLSHSASRQAPPRLPAETGAPGAEPAKRSRLPVPLGFLPEPGRGGGPGPECLLPTPPAPFWARLGVVGRWN